MNYQSTRNAKIAASSTAAVLQGLADDGGLFITKDFGRFDWRGTLELNTLGMAEKILGALLPDFDAMHALVRRAYTGKFETDELTPLVKVGDRYVLELFRGPTSAFKDVALSMLPQLITAARSSETPYTFYEYQISPNYNELKKNIMTPQVNPKNETSEMILNQTKASLNNFLLNLKKGSTMNDNLADNKKNKIMQNMSNISRNTNNKKDDQSSIIDSYLRLKIKMKIKMKIKTLLKIY